MKMKIKYWWFIQSFSVLSMDQVLKKLNIGFDTVEEAETSLTEYMERHPEASKQEFVLLKVYTRE